MRYVLDACAIIAHARDENGAEALDGLFSGEANSFAVHSVNLAEVYYHFLREAGEGEADAIVAPYESGVEIRADGDGLFWRDAARLKAPGGISLADCFCIALARRLDATVVTTDHSEMDPVAASGAAPILFLR